MARPISLPLPFDDKLLPLPHNRCVLKTWSRVTDKSDLVLKYDLLDCSENLNQKGCYNEENAMFYDEIKEIVDKRNKQYEALDKFPDGVVNMMCDIRDPCLELVHNNKYFLHDSSGVKFLDLNAAFGNYIGRVAQEGGNYLDLCSSSGTFTLTLLKMLPDANLRPFMFTRFTPLEERNGYMREKLSEACGPKRKIEKQLYGVITSKLCREELLMNLKGEKMRFVLADGTVHMKYYHDHSEFLMSHLILSELVVALLVLEKGGFILLRVEETYLDFTSSLLYLVRSMFEEMQICKPLSSRWSSAEKYVLFKNYTPDLEIVEYLNNILLLRYPFVLTHSTMVNEVFVLTAGFFEFVKELLELDFFISSHVLECITDIVNNLNSRKNSKAVQVAERNFYESLSCISKENSVRSNCSNHLSVMAISAEWAHDDVTKAIVNLRVLD